MRETVLYAIRHKPTGRWFDGTEVFFTRKPRKAPKWVSINVAVAWSEYPKDVWAAWKTDSKHSAACKVSTLARAFAGLFPIGGPYPKKPPSDRKIRNVIRQLEVVELYRASSIFVVSRSPLSLNKDRVIQIDGNA